MLRQLLLVIVLAVLLVACAGNPASKIPFTDLPAEGDAERGKTLYARENEGTPACTSCHVEEDKGAPSLIGYSTRADQRVEGMSAREYSFWSITEPGRHLVPNFGNAMPNQYDDKLSPQDIADMIAYILTL